MSDAKHIVMLFLLVAAGGFSRSPVLLRIGKKRYVCRKKSHMRIESRIGHIYATTERVFSLISDFSRINTPMLPQNDKIKEVAKRCAKASNCLYLGRGWNFPVALEGALKLKEISYIHAEGYPAAEMKHGPIALIDEQMPVVFIATHHALYQKIISNMQEVISRGGHIYAVVTEGDEQVKKMVDDIIEIPQTIGWLVPLLSVIPLQLLSYHVAVAKGLNVDQPRNLAKSVTVE